MEKGTIIQKLFGKHLVTKLFLQSPQFIRTVSSIIQFYDYSGKLCLRESLLQQNPCTSFREGNKFSFPISTVSVSDKGHEFIK